MFYKKNKIKNSDISNTTNVIPNKGVTLLEVIVIVGIFGMLLSVVIFRYSSFVNNTDLTNMAYEVALSIREAQFFGTAVKGYTSSGSNEFEKNIGLHFQAGTKVYSLFLDDDPSSPGVFNSNDTTIDSVTLRRSMGVSELKNCSNGNIIDPLDVLFDRPNPEPILPLGANEVQIRISSSDGTNHRYVRINSVGAINVSDQSCP